MGVYKLEEEKHKKKYNDGHCWASCNDRHSIQAIPLRAQMVSYTYLYMEDFDGWNKLKKELHEKETKILFKEGEIWWVSLGQNIGEESYGKGEKFRRPVIIFRKLTGSSCIAIPLTSKERLGTWYFTFEVEGVKKYAMMHQMKMLSSKRFESRMTTMPEKEVEELKNAVAKFYNIF
jgi:UDP-N-acetylbacillosamine transaminase